MNPWKQLLYHPVMVFGLAGAMLTAVAAATENNWVGIAAVAFVAGGSYITEHFTNSRRWVEETYGGPKQDRKPEDPSQE